MKNRKTVQKPYQPKAVLGQEPDERGGARTADRLNIHMRRVIFTDWLDVFEVIREEADRRRIPFSQIIRDLTYDYAMKIAKERGEKGPQKRYTETER